MKEFDHLVTESEELTEIKKQLHQMEEINRENQKKIKKIINLYEES